MFNQNVWKIIFSIVSLCKLNMLIVFAGRPPAAPKSYDYLLKVLLVGDSDVGKQEILQDLEDGSADSPFCSGSGKPTLCKWCLILILSLSGHLIYGNIEE